MLLMNWQYDGSDCQCRTQYDGDALPKIDAMILFSFKKNRGGNMHENSNNHCQQPVVMFGQYGNAANERAQWRYGGENAEQPECLAA